MPSIPRLNLSKIVWSKACLDLLRLLLVITLGTIAFVVIPLIVYLLLDGVMECVRLLTGTCETTRWD